MNGNSRIKIVLNVNKASELGSAAYDVAKFIEILREQAPADYEVDVKVTVNTAEKPPGPPSDLTPLIGFTAERREAEEEDAE
ncbi:hypothetical protein [Paenibacillus agricola]|uniref:Uncharacterized protein n=1 Tax=Paenibacillus agricola TaxID=2716264 RepID=A0ABX0J5V8_9BACL|nr:hypothetical protein [Paenibacillus agricola]NHN31176.1 hypothetical protein [Paenibacillus agricola]